jgi:hypothetical protein
LSIFLANVMSLLTVTCCASAQRRRCRFFSHQFVE